MDAGHCRTGKERTELHLPSFHAVAERNVFQQTIQISNLKHLHLGGRFPSSHSSSQSQLIALNLVFSFRMDFIKPPAYFTAHMLCQLSLHNAKLKAVTYSNIKASFQYSLYRSPFGKLLKRILTTNSRGDQIMRDKLRYFYFFVFFFFLKCSNQANKVYVYSFDGKSPSVTGMFQLEGALDTCHAWGA